MISASSFCLSAACGMWCTFSKAVATTRSSGVVASSFRICRNTDRSAHPGACSNVIRIFVIERTAQRSAASVVLARMLMTTTIARARPRCGTTVARAGAAKTGRLARRTSSRVAPTSAPAACAVILRGFTLASCRCNRRCADVCEKGNCCSTRSG